MSYDMWPQTCDLLEAFDEEISAIGGKVTDTCESEGRLYCRSTLPSLGEVLPGDKHQAGVALRATDADIRVHPYTFRLVCRNGAILAEAVQTTIIQRDDIVGDVLAGFRQALRDCCTLAAFQASLSKMRSATDRQADRMINFLPMLARIPVAMRDVVLRMIEREFEAGRDRTQYGLMNAVTAAARQTRDPEVRWRLEELGGGIPALLRPRHSPWSSTSRVKLRAVEEAIA